MASLQCVEIDLRGEYRCTPWKVGIGQRASIAGAKIKDSVAAGRNYGLSLSIYRSHRFTRPVIISGDNLPWFDARGAAMCGI